MYVPNDRQRGRTGRKILGSPTNPQERQAADGNNCQDDQEYRCHDGHNRSETKRMVPGNYEGLRDCDMP
jgi:hypothetical protein